jgi:GT2 family glycosyltransferase
MYYEDSEWQYRAHINGLKTIYEPRCVAIHDEGSSSGTDITKGMKKYQEINRVQFLKLMRDKTNLKIETFNE